MQAIGVECIEVDNGARLGEDESKFDATSVQEALARILGKEDAGV